jgi:tetratricopeptide (TPR) repeat protein
MSRRSALACLTFFLLLLASGAAQAQVRLAATLLALQGQAQVRRSGTAAFLPGFRKMPLGPGDLLRTGPRSTAHLLFIDGSALTLNQNSALVIPALAARAAQAGTLPQRLQLQRGELWARLVKGRRLRFDTPTAVAGIRGTELNLLVDADGTTTLTVAEGEVSFTNERGQGEVRVRASQQSVVRPGALPTPPVTVNVPFLIEWTRDVLPAVLLLETRFVSSEPGALAAAERAAQALPEGPARGLAEGDLAHDRGQLLQALALYERALAALPVAAPAAERARLEGRRGQALLELGRIEAALTAFRASIAADPAAVEPRLGLVQALLSRRQLEAALTEAQAAVAIASGPGAAPAEGGAGPAGRGGGLAGVRPSGRWSGAAAKRNEFRTPASAPPPGALRLVVGGAADGAAGPSSEPAARTGANSASAARAHLTLALVQLRRGEREAATAAVAQALSLAPAFAQAHAWQAYLLAAAGQLSEAERAARMALQLEPRSAVAQQSLADVLFRQGRPRPARAAARAAVALNPLSAAAQVALGQAELSLGEIEAAARAAHRAVALDPDLERGRYLLGVAMAQQHNLIGAQRQLRQALALSPAMTEARVLLARVLNEEGRRGEAEREARAAVAQAPEEAATHSALGSILWRQGRLGESAESYQAALERAPGSLVAHLELARVYLNANNVPDALHHALEAVNLAPGSGEAHTTLGLVYERAGNDEQALRQYREAIGLSPENALARIGLALQNPRAEEGLAELAQALLRDPAVPQQLDPQGITTELSVAGGTHDQWGTRLVHRDQYARGRLHDITFGEFTRDGGWRGDDTIHSGLAALHLAARPTPRWNALYRLAYRSQRLGLPGPEFDPLVGNRHRNQFLEHWLGTRLQVATRTNLWLQGSYRSLGFDFENPGAPAEGPINREQTIRTRRSGLELRLDHRLTRSTDVTAGLATSNEPTEVEARIFNPFVWSELEVFGHGRLRDDIYYAQLDRRVGRLSLIGGVQKIRRQDREAGRIEGAGEGSLEPSAASGASDWMPYAAGVFQLAPRTFVRLLANERTRRLGSVSLLPTEAFVTSEAVETGLNGRLRSLELDLSHRFSARSFAKLFLFRNDARGLSIEEMVDLETPTAGFDVPRARVEGVGLRLEQQLSPFLAGYLRWTSSRTTDRGQGLAHGWQLPWRPRSAARLGLNYVDRAGSKGLLELTYTGGVYAEGLWTGSEGFDSLAPRPRENGRLLVNLQFGRERSIRQEWVLSIENLLNHSYRLWSGIPARGRTLGLGLVRRW